MKLGSLELQGSAVILDSGPVRNLIKGTKHWIGHLSTLIEPATKQCLIVWIAYHGAFFHYFVLFLWFQYLSPIEKRKKKRKILFL